MRTYRFDRVDAEQVRQMVDLSPGQRLRAVLDTQRIAVGLVRGRLRGMYPELSPDELNLRVLEEIERAKRATLRSEPLR